MQTNRIVKAPFPYFGGKSRIAEKVWEYFGKDIKHYIEPFFGSGAALLAKPPELRDVLVTVNDASAFVCNFWRAIKQAPEDVATHAYYPMSEIDLFARQNWLVEQKENLINKLLENPNYYDAKIAGWWVWGMCSWLGSRFCEKLIKRNPESPMKIQRKINLSRIGDGILGASVANPFLGKLEITNGENNIEDDREDRLLRWFGILSNVFRHARICYGDFERVLEPCILSSRKCTGDTVAIFLDPPYLGQYRKRALYEVDSMDVAKRVEKWCKEHQDDKRLRIALCGYEGDYDLPNWDIIEWKGRGISRSQNNEKERIWCNRSSNL